MADRDLPDDPAVTDEDDTEWGVGEPVRRPRWVYGVGHEIDPRFSLANERTMLAWIRTALALLAGSVALEVVDLKIPDAVVRVVSIVLGVLAAGAAAGAWVRWARIERDLRTDRPLPPPRAALIVVLVVAVVGLVLAVWPK